MKREVFEVEAMILEMAIKKGILHVQLVDGLRSRGGNAEDDLNHCRLDGVAERLIIVNGVVLGELLNNPMGFVASKSTIGMVVMLEDPLARDDVGAGR